MQNTLTLFNVRSQNLNRPPFGGTTPLHRDPGTTGRNKEEKGLFADFGFWFRNRTTRGRKAFT